MEKDHKFFHQTTFVKINQFIKMKKISKIWYNYAVEKIKGEMRKYNEVEC